MRFFVLTILPHMPQLIEYKCIKGVVGQVEILIKIVVAVLNFVCFLVTLAYPCDATVFALLPVIITSSMWIVESVRKVGLNLWSIILMSFSAIMGGICLFFGLTSTLPENLQNLSDYSFVFKSKVAIIGGWRFSYNIFAIGTIVMFLSLTIPELILFGNSNGRAKGVVDSFDGMVDRKIGKT